eukprot:scaffold8221_cov936-Pinguiococcus_pyrenoidosus.AAC.1
MGPIQSVVLSETACTIVARWQGGVGYIDMSSNIPEIPVLEAIEMNKAYVVQSLAVTADGSFFAAGLRTQGVY